MMDGISRDEFAMLREQVTENSRRLDRDLSGTQGVGAMAVQIAEVIKDVADLRAEIGKHREEHSMETRARIVGRRWLIGTLIAIGVLVESPLLYLVAHVR